ncbi:MAG: pyridoxamine 5'-phosphate oxidase family protein, partial [Betaproteobacteria bacterium]
MIQSFCSFLSLSQPVAHSCCRSHQPRSEIPSRKKHMTKEYPLSKRNKLRQLREKGRYDSETVHRILDAGLLAQVAFVQDGDPVVVPMIYGREGETIFLHGARKARVIQL